MIPFNLEQFKAGIPAISRCGEVWEFSTAGVPSEYEGYAVAANSIGYGLDYFTAEGRYYMSLTTPNENDLVAMVVQSPH